MATKRTTHVIPHLLAAVSLAWLAACATEAVPTPPPAATATAPAGGAHSQRVSTYAGQWALVFHTSPSPVPLNAPFDVIVQVYDNLGGQAHRTDVDLVVDASMPQHRHGMNRQPILTRRDDGSFLAEGLLFHMAGEWTLTFDVTQDGLTERAEIVLEVP